MKESIEKYNNSNSNQSENNEEEEDENYINNNNNEINISYYERQLNLLKNEINSLKKEK